MTTSSKKADPLAIAADERFKAHKKEQERVRRESDAEDARQKRALARDLRAVSMSEVRNKAKELFQIALERAKTVTIDNEFILPADYSLVQILAAAFIGHPVRLDADQLVVVVNGKRTKNVGHVYFSPTGVIVGVTMKIDEAANRAQLLVYGIGAQTAKWHKGVVNWHLLTARNCPGYPHRLI